MAAIDIGDGATIRSTYGSPDMTYVDANNPANASGKITSVEIYAFNDDMIDVEVATFSANGNNLTTRDSQVIGTVTFGAKRTFEVDLDVVEGDYIGIFYTAGQFYIDNESAGYTTWRKDNSEQPYTGDYIPCTDQTFELTENMAISLYGTGITEAEPTYNFYGYNSS